MADVTYISPEIKMDGILDVTSAKGSTVVLAGHYKGEMRAVDVSWNLEVHLTERFLLNQPRLVEKLMVIFKQSLKLTSSARFEGSILTDELAIDVGAEVSGSISKLQKVNFKKQKISHKK